MKKRLQRCQPFLAVVSHNGQCSCRTPLLLPAIFNLGQYSLHTFRITSYNVCYTKLLRKFKGLFGLNGKVIFVMSDKTGMAADYQGTVTLENTDIGGGDFQTVAQAITWDGNAHYSAPPDTPAEIGTDGLLAVSYNFV